jgi:TATA-box binding protein (TBP) (component of TFIID and TFIIIB)
VSGDDKQLEIRLLERQIKNATRDLKRFRKAKAICRGAKEKEKYAEAIRNLTWYIKNATRQLIKLDGKRDANESDTEGLKPWPAAD